MAKLRFQLSNRDLSSQSKHQSFLQPGDGEIANHEDKDNDVKDIEKEEPVVLAGTDGAGETDGMRKRNNLGEGTNNRGQIGNGEDHARKEKHRRDKAGKIKIEMVNRPDK